MNDVTDRAVQAVYQEWSRRRFLRLAGAPLGGGLLAACGVGVPEDEEAPDAGALGPSPAPAPVPVSSAPPPSPLASPAPPAVAPPPPAAPAPTPPPPPPLTYALPSWARGLPLWQWYEVPGTALSSVEPAVRPLGWTGPRAKIDAWCGAALKRRGSVYLIGAAGGHTDYAGNEVNALTLSSESPAWTELRGPTPNASIIDGTQFYLDGRPSAAHTYYASHHIASRDRLVVFASLGSWGAFPAPPPNFPYTGDRRSFSFDLARGDWDAPDAVAQYPGTGEFIGCICAMHPVTGDVYYSRNYGDGWWRWNAASNTWTRLGGASRAPWYAGAAVDPTRSRILVVGGYGATPPQVHDLSGVQRAASFSGTAAAALTTSGYPGVVYDETLDRFLVLRNDGASTRLLRVHPETWAVDEPALTGVLPAARANGIQNSIQYVPEMRGLVFANRYDGNVLFMRTST